MSYLTADDLNFGDDERHGDPAPEQPLCERCEKRPALPDSDPDAGLCEECATNEAERAYQRQLENYYGGSEPVTMDEQHFAAWEEHQQLHRR